jgi:hypothetical protein
MLFALKGLSARAFYSELTVALGADAIAYSTITMYLHQEQVTSILADLPPKNQRRSSLIKQFSIPLGIHSHSFSSILFYSGAGSVHLHSNDYRPSTPNAITWLCGEASSLGSPHPHA